MSKIIDIEMPQMGESITEATITKWHKQPGDAVKRDETLLEISTAKVEAEIPSAFEGVVSEILYKVGDTVAVNVVIARIAPPGTKIESSSVAAPAAAKVAAVAARDEVNVPKLLSPVAVADAPLNDTNGHGSVTGLEGDTSLEQERNRLLRRRSTPLVRNIARELDIDISQLRGTGSGGRVTRKDIVDFLEDQRRVHGAIPHPHASAAPAPPAAAQAPPTSGMAFPTGEDERFEPLSVMRKQIAHHMVESQKTAAHAYTVFEVDMSRVARLRDKARVEFESRYGVKITPMAFVMKALTEALLAFPMMNASLKDGNIVYHRHVNVGVAVALPHGLIVPVIRDMEEKTMIGIARALADISARARKKNLSAAEVEGGTFTVTNPGQQGALMGTPIIAQPQTAILHIGALHKRAVVKEGPEGDDTIVVRTCCYLTLGLDHRLIDGWVADSFMAQVKARLEGGDFRLFE